MDHRKTVSIVGAGPGGLTAGMILASQGYRVDIYEKQPVVGGRNAALELGPYTFDLGPTFLMMKDVLEEKFTLAGRDIDDYLDLREVDPLYRISWGDGRELRPSRLDREGTRAQIEALFPGNGAGYSAFLEQEAIKYERLLPVLKRSYNSPLDALNRDVLRALPYLDLHKSLYAQLGRYFDDEALKLAFTFQAKYLGMSPWEAPGSYSMIPYVEHSGGVWHPIGGLNKISHAMAEVIGEHGGQIHLGSEVEQVLVEGRRAVGLRLEGGRELRSDLVVLNADFAQAMHRLIPREHLRRWTPERLERTQFSCSTFMLYLGLDTIYDEVPHHTILFADDYQRNIAEVTGSLELSDDLSIYVQNASVLDPTLAPAGTSSLYVLVPVPNLRGDIDWGRRTPALRQRVLEVIERRGGMPGLRQHIEVEQVITPQHWQQTYDVHLGAVFNMAHSFNQMLFFRPHNKFEELDGLFLVGGGTHPGSGLPTIYESAQISASQILAQDGRALAAQPLIRRLRPASPRLAAA